MILSTMRFADYEWEYNPLSVEISHRRIQQEHVLPFYGVEIADMGRQCKVISGKGELLGEDCIEQYKKIESLYLAGGIGVLSVPGMMPIYAHFSGLSVVGETAPDIITYTFEFTEADSADKTAGSSETYVCAGSETLFDIAYDTGTTVDALVELNPWVRRPDEIGEGKEVRLC